MKFFENYKKLFLIIGIFLFLSISTAAEAANIGDIVNFNVDQNFDATSRSAVQATLVKSTSNLYFYIEKGWWDGQSFTKQNEILASLSSLSGEFSNKIYPTLTSVYGAEWNPGIDRDSKITILFESTSNNLGGYFRSQDEYSKLQLPASNEREMLYMPIDQIESDQLKVFLAHEFTHLIVFNQKEKLQGVPEEVWLSEARSDYASTILGYDDVYSGSNLQRRVQDFLNQPGDSLTEWQGNKYDYGVETLFMHYLVDHYGMDILTNSLKSKLVGIPSINEALLKSGAKKDFAQIFTDWTISVVINDCKIDATYCYTNNNLADLKISPHLIFLPLAGSSSLSMNNATKNWAGNWQKIIGGNGDLKLEFSSAPDLTFQVPYIIYDKNNNATVKFLQLDANKRGQIYIKNFGANFNSLIIIPSLQTKLSGFDGAEPAYPYALNISINGNVPQDDPALVQKLLDQITVLKKQIADLSEKNGNGAINNNLCSVVSNNLYFGVFDISNVVCLQQFLKIQGADIYPEGLVTGNFRYLTKAAVMRFQKKYDIPQTGFVGLLTRMKINQLLPQSK